MRKNKKRKSRLSLLPGSVVLLGCAILISFFVVGSMFFLSGCRKQTKDTAKYVFVFMGDGMGINQVTATRYWEALENKQSVRESIWKEDSFDSFPVTGFMSTHNIEFGVTDSSASATTIFTGKKTKNGSLNYNPETEEAYTPFAKKLAESGYAVGVISTTSLEHASPASLYANAENRYEYEEIAHQGINCGWLDFWAAGGFHGEEEAFFEEAEENGFMVVRTPEELKKLDSSSLPVLAAAKSDFVSPYMDYEIDRARAEKYGAENISFADFVKQAVLCMEKKEKFFLFAEAGKIDTACSNGDMISSMHEVKALDDAVAEALAFYQKYPEETLIVVLADHETGSMRIRKDMDCSQISGQVTSYERFETIIQELYEKGASFSEAAEKAEHYFGIEADVLRKEEGEKLERAYKEGADVFTEALCKIKSDEAKIQLVSGSHSGQPVPVYAIGKGAEAFSGVYDNTEIYKKLNTIMGLQE